MAKKFGRMSQFVALEVTIVLISSILFLDQVVFATAGKDEKMGKGDLDVSFVSSGSDWSTGRNLGRPGTALAK